MNMKMRVFRIFTTLSLFGILAIASVPGQSVVRVVADIPFDFVVGNTRLPAGKYTIQPVRVGTGVGSSLLIQNVESHDAAMVLATSVRASAKLMQGKLVFNQYGDQYFLSQIWEPGAAIGREMKKSEDEIELAKSGWKPQSTTLTVPGR